jgi:hypothetical protein
MLRPRPQNWFPTGRNIPSPARRSARDGAAEICGPNFFSAFNGRFAAGAPTLVRFHNFIGGPSLCYPPKRCPETNAYPGNVAVPYLIHLFTNFVILVRNPGRTSFSITVASPPGPH